MKSRDSPPPVHVHVPETTPVHVHMRRSPSTQQRRSKDVQLRADGGGGRVRSPARVKPWIPPGKTPTRRDLSSHKWQDAEERFGSCEKRGSKLDRLMMDAESPKTELRMKESRAQRWPERAIGLRQDAGEGEDELAAAPKKLSVLLREQESNRRFLKKGDSGASQQETDLLLRALVEAEIDGVTVANQLSALKETVDGLAKDKRLSKSNAASLGRQQELLLEKIEIFDHTNHSLRELLREWLEYEKESLVTSEQRDSLKKRLADSEAENIRLVAKLSSKEKEASKLAEHLDFEKDNVKTTEELSKILESTRSHLESQLNRKEAENSHLAGQIQRMQQSHGRQQQELQALQEELQELRQHRDQEQEAGSQEAAALLAQHAERAEQTARQLAARLHDKESQLAQALSTSSDWSARHAKEAAAKGQLEEETAALRIRLAELSSQLQSAGERSRAEREELMEQLHALSAENASTKLENQTLKVSLSSSEEKLKDLQAEARSLKSSVRKQESLVDKYKTKVQQARLEAEEYCLKLDVTQREARDAKLSLERETEQLRRELLDRLIELEPLPDKLRRAELQLREAQQEADARERRSLEQSSALSDVRHRVEQQGSQLETFQQRNVLLQEENSAFREKTGSLDRKLEEMKLENKQMSQVIAAKEAAVRSVQQQLEEKASECSILSRQLEHTLDDTKRQVDDSLTRALAKERASQSKALDLESQLSLARTELSQLHRSKEEMERRFQGQLKNMKDRLEQSDSTNRSLHNYVHFLKTSYGNVFGESLLSS